MQDRCEATTEVHRAQPTAGEPISPALSHTARQVEIVRGAAPETPSSRAHRRPVALLALLGAAVAAYLALFELNLVQSVWDPFFASGSQDVLNSTVATALPIPDAVLGLGAYLAEVALALAGGDDRYRRGRLIYAYGALTVGLAATGVVLIAVQLFVVRELCTLCLASALISMAALALAAPELRAAARERCR